MQKDLRTITLKTAVDFNAEARCARDEMHLRRSRQVHLALTQPDRCAAGASRLCVKKELVQLPNLG